MESVRIVNLRKFLRNMGRNMEINSGNKEVFERMIFILREKLINHVYSEKEISEALVLVALFLRDEFKLTDEDIKDRKSVV